ncbi:MAG: aminotransferase class V-fold PLP-dependent enzyme, partial [Rickettsiales bacterium]|nr:aminotransferase class V-fold PLP-dependent enzyme [Rickettsiales bacterium]
MENIKKIFPIFANRQGLAYLDSAASAQKPASVIDGMNWMYSNMYSNIHRGLYPLSLDASAAYDEARRKTARFLGAREGEVVFVRGTTEAINLVAQSYAGGFGAGDAIIVGGAEHHSNILPWLRLRERGARVESIPWMPDGALDYGWLEKNMSREVKLVAVSGQSNVVGLVNDVARVCEIAHRRGARVLVDAAQMAAHARIDVRELGA